MIEHLRGVTAGLEVWFPEELDRCDRELAEAVAALRSALTPLDTEGTS